MAPDTSDSGTSPENCLVEVLGSDREPVGEAVVAGTRLIVTCAHVVNVALGRDKRDCAHPGDVQIMVRFPFSGKPGDNVVRQFTVTAWLPDADSPDRFDERDAASLSLDESMPPGVRVPTLVPFGYQGGPVMLFGPGGGRGKGSGYVKGEVLGKRDKVRHQVDQHITGSIRARGGFSGGPVWDQATHQVVGLVQAIPKNPNAVDAYVLHAELIEEASGGTLYQVRPCPYVGLRAYTADDATRFFGRREFVEELAEAAKKDSVLIVTGASGLGKSSVVLAGLIPHLKERRNLTVGVCKLSEAPIEEMVGALARAASGHSMVALDTMDTLARKLHDEDLSACAAYVCNATGADRLVLVIDQFERIDNCRNPETKAAFLSLLDALVERPPDRLQVILTVRSDFHHKFASLDGHLGSHFQTSAHWLGPLSVFGLRDAITEPVRAEANHIEFEDGLVDQICDDFRRSELPHLQIALTRLWERQIGHRLTFRAYMELGGVAHALAHHADDCIKQLGSEREEAARRVLTSLVLPDTTDIARPVKRGDLRPADWSVVQELSNMRLVTIGEAPTSPDAETIEIAHEALLRKWERLREWLSSDAEFRRWHAATVLRRDTWVRHDRDPGALLGGVLLAQARDMRERFPEDIAGLSEFIEESDAAAARAELEHRRTLERAEAVRLAGQSEHAINSAPSRLPVALALGVQALRQHTVFEADFAVRRALAIAGRERARIAHDGPVRSVSFSADGTLLATASADRTCQVWDLTEGTLLARLRHTDRVANAVFDPSGALLATAGADGLVRIWDLRTRSEAAALQHDGPVAGLAFAPDGRTLATAGNDRTARIWEFGTGEPARRLDHGGRVAAVAFAPDGRRVATASDDGEARLWSVDAEEPTARWRHDGPVRAIAFHHDGTWIGTASEDGTARIFDAATGRENLRLVHPDRVTAVAFSPNGRHVASAGEDGTARVWDVKIGFEVAHLVHQGQVGSVHFSPDGTRLVTGSRDGTARIWNVATGEEEARLAHESAVSRAVFAAGTTGVVATASDDGTARLWDATAGAETLMLPHDEPVSAIAFSDAGDLIATAGGSNPGGPPVIDGENQVTEARTVRLWDALTGMPVGAAMPHPHNVHQIAFGDSSIATACDDGRARLWNLRDGSLITEVVHRGPVQSVVFNPAATLLATASNDGTAQIWNVEAGADGAVLPHDGWVSAANFSPDGTLLATAAGKVGCLWRVADLLSKDDPPKPTVLQHESAVYEVIFDHTGKRAATVANDGSARIWDAETGAVTRTFPHGSRGKAAFCPDGSLIATAGEDGIAKVWRVDTGALVAHFVHEPAVRSVAFSRDGARLATAGEDGTARLWSLEEKREVTRLPHGGEELVVAFSPDCLRLATASEDGRARVWALSREELIAQACDRLTRNLTETEWSRYLPDVPYQHLRPAQRPDGRSFRPRR